MPLVTGTRLGPYEIVSTLGAGGMGEVYRARDTKLGREVAIKVVLEAFIADRDRLIRFEREARSLAALNHPNIATLLGMEESAGRHFLVMELVEGETLAEKLARAPLPLEAAISTARQIAEALEAAHEKGIVHRDLKPANVKITPDDKVKVLDFGLAKAAEADPASSVTIANSPTISAMATQAGIILGTASYMSPEQARGMPADHRSDIFSFGVVLYEMLTGRQPFQGETVSDVLAAVLAREPDLASLPPDLAPRLSELLRRCLEKQPKRRWQAIGDVRHELEIITGAPRHVPATPAMAAAVAPRPWWRRALPITATAATASIVTGAVMWVTRPAAPPGIVSRFVVPYGEGQDRSLTSRAGLAISPDGTRVAYVANREIYIRNMGAFEATLLTRAGSVVTSSSPTSLVFSPDGRSIAYVDPEGSELTIKRIEVTGGTAVPVCASGGTPYGLGWSGDSILFGTVPDGAKPGAIMRVAASGGQPEALVTLEPGEVAVRPQRLDDGRVLFAAVNNSPDGRLKARVVVQRPGATTRTTLVEGGTAPRYLSSGHLIYAWNGVMFARTFDPARSAVGNAVTVIEGVLSGGADVWYAVSDAGTFAYLPGPVGTNSTDLTIAFFDRAGKAEPLGVRDGPYSEPRMSPDGLHIAFGYSDAKDTSIWVYDLVGGGSARRLSFGGHDRFPAWSANSQRVIFQSDRGGDAGLFWQRADGVGPAEPLTKTEKGVAHIPQSASPDGSVLLLDQATDASRSLMAFSFKDKSITPFGGVVSTSSTGAVFSPNGRWVAYAVREPGQARDAVMVQPFPATGAKVQVSSNSEDGHHQVWSVDGKELYYTPGPGNRMVAVTVMASQGFSFGPALPMSRFFLNVAPQYERTYDAAHDGKHFLGLIAPGAATGTPERPEIRLVLNWFDELKTRAPVK